jgi:hypothetical protein
MMDTTAKILNERPSRHGEFSENSRTTWEMMRAMQRERNWPTLPDGQRHALYMIAHKMARIVTGDPTHEDHWDDIAGYARCVADRLRKPIRPYDGQELYATLALGWNCTREEAMQRVHDIYGKRKAQEKPPATLPEANGYGGTPENGGHHAAASDADAGMEDAVRAVRQELNRGL